MANTATTRAPKEKPAAKKSDEVYIAIMSGCSHVDGEDLIFVKGRTRVRAGHPLLEIVPEYFAPVSDDVHYEA